MKKRKKLIFSVFFIIFLIILINMISSADPSCDGIDCLETFSIWEMIWWIRDKGMIGTSPSCGNKDCFDNSGLKNDVTTANKFCQLMGYSSYKTWKTDDWFSPGDNGITTYNSATEKFDCVCGTSNNKFYLFELTCWKPDCTPNCAGKQCGDNGCGGSCGSCSGSTPYCNTQGKCIECTEDSHCNDNLYCTVDRCNINTNTCQRTAVDCSGQNDACNIGTCNEITDSCKKTPDLSQDRKQCRGNLCCPAGQACDNGVCVRKVYWANMKGEKITTAEIGDTVMMVYEIPYTTVNPGFNIYEDDDYIKTMASFFSFKGFLAAYWTITQDEFNIGMDADEDTGEFHFRINAINSEILNVVKDSYRNSLPTAVIDNPVVNSKFAIGSGGSTGDINFKESSYDEDDNLKAIWDFDDSKTKTILFILTIGSRTTTESYTSSGTKRIVLTVEEIGRVIPQKAKDYSRIFVYKKGFNIFSIIRVENSNNQIVDVFDETKRNYPADTYTFDGSESFVAKCFDDCPSGKTCETIPGPEGNSLDCFKYKTATDTTGFTFEWKVDNKKTSDTGSSIKKTFVEPKEYNVELKVTYSDSYTNELSDETSVSLIIEGGIVCSDNGYFWINYNSLSNPEPTTGDEGNCNNEYAVGSKKCCPVGYKCVLSDTEIDSRGMKIGRCESVGINFCWDFDNENNCENNDFLIGSDENFYNSDQIAVNSIKEINDERFCGRGNNQIESGKTCWDEATCFCEWDNNNNKCTVKQDIRKQCTPPNDKKSLGTCTWTLKGWDDKCNEEGVIYASWDGSWVAKLGNDLGCDDKSQTISCENIIKLDFFNWINFILTMLALIVIYCFYSWKKELSKSPDS